MSLPRKFNAIVVFLIFSQSNFLNASSGSYNSGILDKVQQNVSLLANEGRNPVVLFDIDDTLVLTAFRTLTILNEESSNPKFASKFPEATAKLKTLRPSQVHYDLSDTLATIGVTDPAVAKHLTQVWVSKFFSNKYAANDIAIRGSVEMVQRLYRSGATIAYLTGRDVPRMQTGTVASLNSLGFPFGKRTQLFMKPNKDIDDLEYKQRALNSIKALGTLVAAFENEPANMNAMQTAFPNALMIFLDTRHSNKPDVPNPGISWIGDYL